MGKEEEDKIKPIAEESITNDSLAHKEGKEGRVNVLPHVRSQCTFYYYYYFFIILTVNENKFLNSSLRSNNSFLYHDKYVNVLSQSGMKEWVKRLWTLQFHQAQDMFKKYRHINPSCALHYAESAFLKVLLQITFHFFPGFAHW